MDDKPFQIIVHITRGTSAGRALSLMANGMQCAAATKLDADKIADDFMDASSAVLEGVDPYCFGLLAVVDELRGMVIRTEVLMGYTPAGS